MNTKKSFLLVLATLILAGCATPSIVSSNPASITIKGSFSYNTAASDALANTECQKYGKYALIRPDNIRDSYVTYECVKP